jgi:deoxyribose-phosphate aldolase
MMSSNPLSEENNTRIILDLLDFTLLNHQANSKELNDFIDKTNNSLPGTICVFTEHVQEMRRSISSNVSIAAVAAGFPVGSSTIGEIESCIEAALDAGADEVDCVLEPRHDNDFPGELERSKLVAMRSASKGKVLKVILETTLIPSEEALRAVCRLSLDIGVDFLKTCTGKRGDCTATAARILAEETFAFYSRTGLRRGVKLSGGLRTKKDAMDMLSIVLHHYPSSCSSFTQKESITEGDESYNSPQVFESLTREDKATLRIGASSLLKDLRPELYDECNAREGDGKKAKAEGDLY